MTTKSWHNIAVVALILLSAASAANAQPAAHTAVCAICGPREGADAEPVVHTMTHRGRVYHFCSDACRDEFLTDPDRFAALADEHLTHAAASAGGFAPS